MKKGGEFLTPLAVADVGPYFFLAAFFLAVFLAAFLFAGISLIPPFSTQAGYPAPERRQHTRDGTAKTLKGGGGNERSLSTPLPRGAYFFFLAAFFVAFFLAAFLFAGIEEIPPFSPWMDAANPSPTSRVSRGFAY
jgi:hypothetical protein